MKLRLILGDQLNIQHSWYSTVDQETLYVLYELKQETNYVVHHIQKVVAFFSSMRSFADSLKSIGHEVIYFDIASESANNSLSDNIKKLVVEKQITKFEYQLPDEYRLDKQLINLCEELIISFCDFTAVLKGAGMVGVPFHFLRLFLSKFH